MTAVVLAAGHSSRMGSPKALVPIGGVPMIDRVLTACEAFPSIVIGSPAVAEYVGEREGVFVLVNANPDRGIAHSLALAHAAARVEDALLVFLADKPLVNARLAQTVVRRALEGNADVCFPQRDGIGGHPVFFSARARSRVNFLSGESLQPLRDDPSLHRLPLEIADEGAYFDVDSPSDLFKVPPRP